MALGLSTQKKKDVDISEVYSDLKDKYRNVYIYQSPENEVFLYRTIGRKEYYDLVENNILNTMEKEDIICKSCVLWPENYDFDSCCAGLPSILCKTIIENSLLDSIESQRNCLYYYRKDMNSIDSLITCLINEAFPTIDIEEIETWDVEKTMKYYSRAEWKLREIRGLVQLEDITEHMNSDNVKDKNVVTEEITDNNIETKKKAKKTRTKRRKKAMTPEELNRITKASGLSIDWNNSAQFVSETDEVDTTPMGMRPDGGRL